MLEGTFSSWELIDLDKGWASLRRRISGTGGWRCATCIEFVETWNLQWATTCNTWPWRHNFHLSSKQHANWEDLTCSADDLGTGGRVSLRSESHCGIPHAWWARPSCWMSRDYCAVAAPQNPTNLWVWCLFCWLQSSSEAYIRHIKHVISPLCLE